MMEIVDTDPLVKACDHSDCGDTGVAGDLYCPKCDGDWILLFDMSRLFTLAHNLAVAGAMQRMYNMGSFAVLMFERYGHDEWKPNAEGRALR